MYKVEPYKCSQCGEIDCNHPMVGDKPSLPNNSRWDKDDWVCPGGNNCDCHDN